MVNLNADPELAREDIVRDLLELTQTDRLPTDVNAVASYLKLTVSYFSTDTGFNLHPSIRAFLAPDLRYIGVSSEINKKSQRFCILHEIGHFVLPGHATHPQLVKNGVIEDDTKSLSINSIVQLEIEANQFASDMLFQLDHFDARLRAQTLNWHNIKQAANDYDASFESTARRWVERAYTPCALIVFNPKNRSAPASPLEVHYTITSSSFRQQYFEKPVVGTVMDYGSPIFEHFYSYRDDTPTFDVQVTIAGGEAITFDMHLFSNSYREFALLTPKE